MTEESLNTYYDSLGATLGETLLTPTRIYVKALNQSRNQASRLRAAAISRAADSMRTFRECFLTE